ncbi:MAG: hypothetical protein ACFCUL_14390 [Flavobacteriaceae bacterium]
MTASKTDNGLILDAVFNELVKSDSDYLQLEEIVGDISNSDPTSKSDAAEKLADLLAAHHLQIYFPYADQIITGKNIRNDFYVTFDPVVYTDVNEGFKYVEDLSKQEGYQLVSIGNIDNRFLDANPVYVVGPIDECDLPGNKCNYVDLEPASTMIANKTATTAKAAVLLTTNQDHTKIEEKDILSTRFSGFRFSNGDWLGFAATHQKFVLKRGSGSYSISSNGIITASLSAFDVGGEYRIKARGAKKGWWYDVNETFDDDWNMTENEQAFAIFTKHHLSAIASKELQVKGGIALSGGQPTPTAEATSTNKLTVTVGGAIFRSNIQLSRRQVLATIVGTGITGAVRDGTNWNAKKTGIFHFYFKHYLTDF